MTLNHRIAYTEVNPASVTEEVLNIGQFANHVLYDGDIKHHVLCGFIATGKSYLMDFVAMQALTSGSHKRIAMVCGMPEFHAFEQLRVKNLMDIAGLYGQAPVFRRASHRLVLGESEIMFFRRPYVPVYEDQQYREYRDLLDPSVVAFKLPIPPKIIGYQIIMDFHRHDRDLVLIDDASLHCYYISDLKYGIDHHEAEIHNVFGKDGDNPALGVWQVGFELAPYRLQDRTRIVYATDNPFLYHGLNRVALSNDVRGYALGNFTNNTGMPPETAMQLGVIYNDRAN